MKDIVTLFKVYMIDTLSNKFAFVYNLLIPIVYFIYQNRHIALQNGGHFNTTTFKVVSYFWAYIIVVTILNNVIVSLIADRERGFYKQMLFIAGSKLKIMLSAFSVQLMVILIEITLFNVVVMLFVKSFSLHLILAGLLTVLITALPIALVTSLLFMFKFKLESVNIILSLLIFGMLFFMNIPNGQRLESLVALINPASYVAAVGYQIQTLLINSPNHLIVWLGLAVATLLYAIIGKFAIAKFSPQSVIARV
ncbi:hypothetical protein FGL83_07595 [Leuconostoc lactis]|uniref:Uncharacterized protein n=1 Tax=Leuconostoc lactis TaxID=1246 RepID=A0AAP9EDQ8_LEULA|nr:MULTISPECIES: hypothetical protein [Leuconostoc]ANY12306.1 hypothetical protein BCR17_07930 [Leuconostoc lactis]MBU7537832.1 hypothetical protein [Leuconostoc lactis]MCC2744222.1 hypothetical protein [Leuconostoc lactis]MCC2754451.1 hypothetical protein [Leuconostoc lactis]MCT3055256.1 hypothetical protein [Leuconostoc citreum]